MLRNYLKIAWRNLMGAKSFGFLNILGLSIGMAASILILLWVQNEVSYDKFHSDAKRTFRFIVGVEDFRTAVAAAGLPYDLNDQLPEIEEATVVSKLSGAFISAGSQELEETGFMAADSNFLSFFDFPLLYGQKDQVLNAPDAVVLTEAKAEKYFGSANEAIGKTLLIKNNNRRLTVTGVLKNLPANTHFKFDFLTSIRADEQFLRDIKNSPWDNFNYYAYMKLNPAVAESPASLAALDGKIDGIWNEKQDNMAFDFSLQPIEDIHLYSDLQIDVAGNGNIQYVKIFFFVALFILVVACINFMNLATARSAKRSKEVGLRKSVGAERTQLIAQFLSESVLISFLSLILAVGLVYLFLPLFNQLSGKELQVNITETSFLLSLLVIVLVTGLLSGSYPALYLSGFNPVKVLKGTLKISGGNLLFRNALVVTQFVISAVLIVGTAVVFKQLNYISTMNLGFDKENLIIVPFRGELGEKQDALRSELSQHPFLADYAFFNDMPDNLDTGTTNVSWDGKEEEGLVVPNLRVDDRFTQTFGIEVLAGRTFKPDFAKDDNNFVINETLMKKMGHNLDNIIGQKLHYNHDGIVIGVVKDFHFKPLQYAIEPLVLQQQQYGQFMVVKTTVSKTEKTLEALKKVHADLNPAFPFTYSFFDENIENMYDGERQMGQIFNLLAVLAIFISCLGIYGLSAFMAEQRTKEMGIRKVLGATTAGLVNLMSKDFIKLVFLALLISVPLSAYYLNSWLEDFAYHTSISWWMYVLAGILLMAITLVTVGYQGIKTALVNPVKSLNAE